MSVSVLVYLALRDGVGFGEAFRRMPIGASLAVALFFAISSTLYVTALTLAPVANVSALVALSPLFVAVLSRSFTGEKVNTIIWSGTLLSLAGVIFVMRDGIQAGYWVGNVVALLVAVGFAGQTISLRRFREFDIVPAIFLGGFLVFLVAGFVGGGFRIGIREAFILAAMGPLQLGIPLILFVIAARSVPAVTLALIALLDVGLNPLWARITSDEEPTGDALIGATAIVAAVVLSIVGGLWIARRPIQSTDNFVEQPAE